jgi:hypothetical protein
MNLEPVAQVSKPAIGRPGFGSPISKSAGRRKIGRVGLAGGTRVGQPAIQPTWQPALHQRESSPGSPRRRRQAYPKIYLKISAKKTFMASHERLSAFSL